MPPGRIRKPGGGRKPDATSAHMEGDATNCSAGVGGLSETSRDKRSLDTLGPQEIRNPGGRFHGCYAVEDEQRCLD